LGVTNTLEGEVVIKIAAGVPYTRTSQAASGRGGFGLRLGGVPKNTVSGRAALGLPSYRSLRGNFFEDA